MDKKNGVPGTAPDARKRLGKQGEEMGAAWLAARGMRILERNYRCRIGEIDIIGQCEDLLVFVEVKSRSSDRWGMPAESVDCRKQLKLRRLAACYLLERGLQENACRFDVLGILYGGPGETPLVEWFPDAF